MRLSILSISNLSGFFPTTLTNPIPDSSLTTNGVPFSTRAYWMRQANKALVELSLSPCPFSAFSTVIVNHTNTDELGDLVCMGVNQRLQTGNPAMHGEITAITNCTAILTDPAGRFRLTPSQAQAAFADLTLYTNAESCTMCASAIRWAGFKEYVYGTSIDTLAQKGWAQINISSSEVFKASFDLPSRTRLIGGVLANETDPYFLWQYDRSYPCPGGCARAEKGASCRIAM
ncbi:nucleoside deaminase [Aspergillus alliaceus]|uniref:nucleoside deaminase n=1 Tax=Petromyces alliaceus TaxID=209559 RepID=UPI0012A770FB|nr:cytidine deaminase-like protein [Aspergillus alliaceus]KAB8229762.1 cytidine deaminase-like protein [Aspergillus alliaceus]